jgi:hypothetical protein
VRDGQTGQPPVPEEWTIGVGSIGGGDCLLEVSIQGPPRTPPGPSPREPGFSLFMPMKDEAFSGTEILRLFHRPDLTPRGMRAVLDRDVKAVEGSVRRFPLVFQGRTRLAHELTISIEDASLVRGTYRLVVVPDLPAPGILEAELDETWTATDADGNEREERRHEKLELVDSHG